MHSPQNTMAIESALREAARNQNYFSKTSVDQYPQDYVIVENSHYNYCEKRIDRNVYMSLLASGFIEAKINEHGKYGFRVSDKS